MIAVIIIIIINIVGCLDSPANNPISIVLSGLNELAPITPAIKCIIRWKLNKSVID